MLFYLVAYLFMNLGAFAVVAFLRNQTGSEDLADFRGLVRRSPWMVVTLAIFLLSLLGIPPLVGFAAKFQIFSVLFDAGQTLQQHREAVDCRPRLHHVCPAGDRRPEHGPEPGVLHQGAQGDDPGTAAGGSGRPEPDAVGHAGRGLGVRLILAIVLVVLGIAWGPLSAESDTGVEQFRKVPAMLVQGEREMVRGSRADGRPHRGACYPADPGHQPVAAKLCRRVLAVDRT